MRRPRGPGGRFLTADEIAAQKVPATDHPSPSNPIERDPDDVEDDDIVVPANRDPLLRHTPDHMGIMYSLQSHPAAISQSQSQSSPTKASSNNIFPQRFKGSTNSTPVTLSSPYPPAQIHHVSHPHTDARHHHTDINFSSLYGSTETNAAEIQRRTEEIIQFGATGGS